jgi:NADPH:quinone reductase
MMPQSVPQSHLMRAVEISKPGGPEVLTPCDRPVPVPGQGEIVIRVAWAGVNRPDISQRAGAYPPPPGASDLPGLEASGHVAATGPGVTRWKEGDAVCALLPGGGYAEYVATPAAHALPIPEGMSPARRRLPARELLHRLAQRLRARPPAGGRALPRPRRLVGDRHHRDPACAARGARVFATAGSAEKCAACERLGAERAINYREADFVEISPPRAAPT